MAACGERATERDRRERVAGISKRCEQESSLARASGAASRRVAVHRITVQSSPPTEVQRCPGQLRTLRRMRHTRAFAGIALLVFACSLPTFACAGDQGSGEARSGAPPPVATPAGFPKPGRKSIAELREGLRPGPVLAPSVSLLEPGRNRFAFGLFDAARKQIADTPVAVYVARKGGGRVHGPFPAHWESLETPPAYQSEITSSDPDAARSLYVADVAFPKTGHYEVLGVVRLDKRLMAAEPVTPTVPVIARSAVPAVGAPAPRISTPTKASAGAIEGIETRIPPDSMHDVDYADAIGKRPILLLFSTPALCQSRVCAPVNDIAEQVKAAHKGDTAFIHMEIYNDNRLEKGFRPQVARFKLPTEPWAFAIDRTGKVAARLEGAFTARELEGALKVAARPG